MPVDLLTNTISPQLAEDTYVAVTDKIEDKLGRKGSGESPLLAYNNRVIFSNSSVLLLVMKVLH